MQHSQTQTTISITLTLKRFITFFDIKNLFALLIWRLSRNNDEKHKNHQMSTNADLYDEALLDYMELYYLTPYQNTAFVHCWNKFFQNLIDMHALRFNENLNQLEDVDFVFRYLYPRRQTKIRMSQVFHHVDKLGPGLSNCSGLEENSLKNFTIALEAPKKLKRKLLFKCQKMETVPFWTFFLFNGFCFSALGSRVKLVYRTSCII